MNKITFNKVSNDTIIELVSLLSKNAKAKVWAKSERWVIDAKSMLGLLALAHEGMPITFESEDETIITKISTLMA